MVSTATNNTGLANNPQHHVLREAQQQRLQARPGPHSSYGNVNVALSGNTQYMASPNGTPQTQQFDPSSFDINNISFDAYTSHMNAMMSRGQAAYGDNMMGGKDFDMFNNDSALSTPTYMNFPESPSAQGWASEGDTSSTRKVSRRISNGILDRVNKFENLPEGFVNGQVPSTPPNGIEQNYCPPTPIETPQGRLVKTEATPNRFKDGYDESMEETIKPVRHRGGNRRAQAIFEDMQKQSEEAEQQQSLDSNTRRSLTMEKANSIHGLPQQTPDFMSMNNFNSEFLRIQNSLDMSQQSPQHMLQQRTQQLSQQFPQQMAQASFVNTSYTPELNPYPLNAESLSALPSALPSDTLSRRQSPHRRTDSQASSISAASIADINIEETKKETGVTLEEISKFIQGPDASDGKWTCLFESCGKKFGRKENIKSHVQTHLDDRQYQCPKCQKCFVRQHDLKRHAKIHTGVKPYPCECGNDFARHDALTRHRQRGMCIGAFDGIVRKTAKRGRPKKNRPDMDTRLEKSARTRKKNMSISSMSSISGCSDTSSVNTPDAEFNNMFDNVESMGMGSQTQHFASGSSAPMTSMPGPTVTEEASSPSAVSGPAYVSPRLSYASPGAYYAGSPGPSYASSGPSHASPVPSYVSPEILMEGIAMNHVSPARSVASQYNTPPELSQSSSPTPAQVFDVDPNSSIHTDDLTALSGTSALMTSSTLDGAMPYDMGADDDEMLRQFANAGGLVALDRDSSMLMNKFDEEFEDAVEMFTNNNDTSNTDIFFDNA